MSRCSHATAFSLVELLAVVAILAILAALIFPAAAKMQAKGQDAKCAGNLRQIGVAFVQFLADNNGSFPNYISAPAQADFYPYLELPYNYTWQTEATFKQSVYTCPRVNSLKGHRYNSGIYTQNTYLLNDLAGTSGPQRIGNVAKPSKTFVYTEGTLFGPSKSYNSDPAWNAGTATFSANPIDQIAGRFVWLHDGTKGFLFLDGHVEHLRWSQVNEFLKNPMSEPYKEFFGIP